MPHQDCFAVIRDTLPDELVPSFDAAVLGMQHAHTTLRACSGPLGSTTYNGAVFLDVTAAFPGPSVVLFPQI